MKFRCYNNQQTIATIYTRIVGSDMSHIDWVVCFHTFLQNNNFFSRLFFFSSYFFSSEIHPNAPFDPFFCILLTSYQIGVIFSPVCSYYCCCSKFGKLHFPEPNFFCPYMCVCVCVCVSVWIVTTSTVHCVNNECWKPLTNLNTLTSPLTIGNVDFKIYQMFDYRLFVSQSFNSSISFVLSIFFSVYLIELKPSRCSRE